MIDVQQEYQRLVSLFSNPQFTDEESASIADKLDQELGLASIAARLWMGLPPDNAFASQPAMFMVKPPGANLAIKLQEHIQWTWRQHHFMLFTAPLNEPGKSMLGLLIDNDDPVLEVYVEHEFDDKSLLKHHKIYAVKSGEWIEDFLSYYGAYCRLRAISEATREKYRVDMEEFWRSAGI